MFVLAALILVTPAAASEPDTYRFLLDPRVSVEAGAVGVQSTARLLLRSLDRLDDRELADEPFQTQVAARGLRGLLIDFPLIFQTTLFVHEAVGHPVRAREAGGGAKIVGRWPLLPGGSPLISRSRTAGWTATDEVITVLGGYEANHALGLSVQKLLYERGSAQYQEPLLAVVNKLQAPFGAYVRDHSNPADPAAYIEPKEDTPEFAAAFQRSRGKPVLTTAGAPDPAMVKFFKESRLAGLWTLADPLVAESFYHVGWSLANMKRERELWMFTTGETRWMYGTQFNFSPLGYELYLNLYLKRGPHAANGYVRYGRPLRNNGLGFETPELLRCGRAGLGGGFDVWSQEGRGAGGSGHVLASLQLTEVFALYGRLGAKTPGYLMAQPVRSGGYGYGGVEARF